ncbi:L,D-transpeptidase family protein [Kitasatospora sp. NBC_01250]|uniref:L,D-transpeptidase family protein n=1 Tax=Kitasatospora sp. NBC_01250 TaxID=2903571 RepID=UPI003FA58AD7
MSGTRRAAERHRPAGAAAAGSTGGRAAPGPRAQARGRRRKARRRRGATSAGTAALLAVAAVGWFGFGPGGLLGAHGSAALARSTPLALPPQASAAPQGTPGASTAATPAGQPTAGDPHSQAPGADRSDRADGSYTAIPGLGAGFSAKIPAQSTQVVLAAGAGKDSSDSTVTLWNRTPDGRWRPGTAWSAHNGDAGWSTDHTDGDLRSPIGVYTLSDAGGLKPDPGSKLPYHQDDDFVAGGTGFNGESLAGAFDYVVAIDYNRVVGTSPLDLQKPLGAAKGGGIWLHVDHGGPTHACVSLAEDHMTELLRTLDPAAHPVIVMGDAASLAT